MPSDDVTLGEVARRLDNLQRDTHGILERLDRDYVRADSVKEITRRVTALEDGQRWLVRLVLSLIITALVGVVIVQGGGLPG